MLLFLLYICLFIRLTVTLRFRRIPDKRCLCESPFENSPRQPQQPTMSSAKRTPASPADFFISYNHRDLATAEVFRMWLEQEGFTTFIQSRDFHTGSNFLERMNEGIKCERLLAVHTAH